MNKLNKKLDKSQKELGPPQPLLVSFLNPSTDGSTSDVSASVIHAIPFQARNYYKSVSENKEIVKLVSVLSSSVSSTRKVPILLKCRHGFTICAQRSLGSVTPVGNHFFVPLFQSFAICCVISLSRNFWAHWDALAVTITSGERTEKTQCKSTMRQYWNLFLIARRSELCRWKYFSNFFTSLISVKRFMQGSPLLSEFESRILFYRDLELKINSEPECMTVGALALFTGKTQWQLMVFFDGCHMITSRAKNPPKKTQMASRPTADLKMSLTAETKNWMVDYGQLCNKKYRSEMEQIFGFVDEAGKKLNRKIKDLDDIRIAMAALKEIREHQISTDFQVGPIEVTQKEHKECTRTLVSIHQFSLQAMKRGQKSNRRFIIGCFDKGAPTCITSYRSPTPCFTNTGCLWQKRRLIKSILCAMPGRSCCRGAPRSRTSCWPCSPTLEANCWATSRRSWKTANTFTKIMRRYNAGQAAWANDLISDSPALHLYSNCIRSHKRVEWNDDLNVHVSYLGWSHGGGARSPGCQW